MNQKIGFKGKGMRYYTWRIGLIMAICAIVYYVPDIVGSLGYTSSQVALNRLHDFYGLDLYALVFFVPVVYAAYTIGVLGAVAAALIAMLPLLYHELVVVEYQSVLFRPTAFVIIMSAVGAAIAMIQKNDIQRERNMNELRCLYEVGKAADECTSVDEFMASAVNNIPRIIRYSGETKVRMVVRDKVYETDGFTDSPDILSEDLSAGGEVFGRMELYCTGGDSYLRKQRHWVKALAERIGSAVHEIELGQSLKAYYGQLEDMVEKRTRDLEQTQEKLIRSERLAAVGELASGVGHELRNPLNVIRNCAYLLNMSLDGKLDEEAMSTLGLLDHQVDVMNRIVTDLLDFTRVSPPSPSKLDLNMLVKDSLSWISVPGNVIVKTSLDTASPEIYVDGEQVGRAFANIISNAIQAMNDGGELRISTGADGKGDVFASFEDTGCGIPEENMKKIFEPLFTTKPKGIGLGLAITRRLVSQNDGTIEIKSQVGKGTTFTLRLPRQRREAKLNERAGERISSR
ncbi:MAG: ATP-binding protein [Dehalococcoidia bacterium]|nr:ATP-binding protein [Dehalococcoidia bacterium]